MLDRALIAQANAAFSDPWRCFGLEAKAAWLLENALGKNAPRKSFYRIAPEPILWSFWPELSDLRLSQSRALELTSLLTGQRQSYRTKPIFGSDEQGRRFYFARHASPADLEAHLLAARCEQRLDIALTNLFLAVIHSHPFTDGNGRLARALLLGLLAHSRLIDSPCLPLNSLFHARAAPLGRAFRAAVTQGQRDLLQASLCAAIDEAAKLACVTQEAAQPHINDTQTPRHPD